jgi:hypothetical protein
MASGSFRSPTIWNKAPDSENKGIVVRGTHRRVPNQDHLEIGWDSGISISHKRSAQGWQKKKIEEKAN